MSQTATTNYAKLVVENELRICDLPALRKKVFSSEDDRSAFEAFVRDARQKTSPQMVDLEAVVKWVNGDHEGVLDSADGLSTSPVAQFILASSALACGQARAAVERLGKLAAKEAFPEVYALLAKALRRLGDVDGARKAASDGLKKAGEGPELLVEAGILDDCCYDYSKSAEKYNRALALDESCVEALFRLAYLADIHGDNERALEFYQRCAKVRPVRSNVLFNLGLLYEEYGRLDDAVKCYRLILSHDPANVRARLYLRDAVASEDMYFDEEQQKRRERRNKILETPITDFELSVRSRNCLEKMNVTTLGDLTRIGEPELLTFKNFGETSLSEIKRMMTSRGLKLGQALEKESRPDADRQQVPVEKEDPWAKLLAATVDELGLSVRAQHCMQMLGIHTVGDLMQKSEKELLGAKNFGSTSLTEVRRKLAAKGLSLSSE